MALNKSVVSSTKLIQLILSLRWFDLHVCLTYVETLIELIKIWPNMRCNHQKPVPCYANQFFQLDLFGKLCMLVYLILLRFFRFVMHAVDDIVNIFALLLAEQKYLRYPQQRGESLDFRKVWGFPLLLAASCYLYLHGLVRFVPNYWVGTHLLCQARRVGHLKWLSVSVADAIVTCSDRERALSDMITT